MTYLNVEPPLDPLRSDPRFVRMLDLVGLPAKIGQLAPVAPKAVKAAK